MRRCIRQILSVVFPEAPRGTSGHHKMICQSIRKTNCRPVIGSMMHTRQHQIQDAHVRLATADDLRTNASRICDTGGTL